MSYQPTPEVLLANGFKMQEGQAQMFSLELANECELTVYLEGNLPGLLLYGPMSFFPDGQYSLESEEYFVSIVSQLVERAKTEPVTYRD